MVQGVVDKQIRYIASKASWPLHGKGKGASYEALDRILARGMRRITGNMASFPQRLLWADRSMGGFGINSITQSAQEDKLANIIIFAESKRAKPHKMTNWRTWPMRIKRVERELSPWIAWCSKS